LGCIDSRAVPELIFDQGIGDLFSVRVAGNVIDNDVLASLEFACTLAGTRLIVVKGHTRCGAIQGACQGVNTGHLQQLLGKIQPAIEEAKEKGYKDTDDISFRDNVSHINALHSVARIKEQSPILRDLWERGDIAIIAAMYDVSSGVVTFYDEN
jgi:carbonic anhydrase